jgi:hypothetical protein
MGCFDKLFTVFSFTVVVILFLVATVSAAITIIDKGNSNIYSAEKTKKQYFSNNFYVTEL